MSEFTYRSWHWDFFWGEATEIFLGGRQSSYFDFFWKNLLTGRHFREGAVKWDTLYIIVGILIFYVVSFEIFSFFHPIFPTLINAGEALHLEVRIRPSPSLQATPVRVLKIVPEYPHVITFLKYSASLNWNLSSVYIRDRCYMLCHLQMFCWWYLHDHKGHPINIRCPFQGNICHCCLNRR